MVNAAGCKLVMTNPRPRFKRALTWLVVFAVQAVLVAMVVDLGSLRPHLLKPRTAFPHRPLRRRCAVLRPPGGAKRPEPAVLIAGDARTPPGTVRRALRGPLAQLLRRGGRDQQVGLSASRVGGVRRRVRKPLFAHLCRSGAAPARKRCFSLPIDLGRVSAEDVVVQLYGNPKDGEAPFVGQLRSGEAIAGTINGYTTICIGDPAGRGSHDPHHTEPSGGAGRAQLLANSLARSAAPISGVRHATLRRADKQARM